MGYLLAFTSVHNENMSEVVRHILIVLRELLWTLSLHIRVDNSEVFKEVQEDGFRGDDDIPAEHANKRMDRVGFVDNNSGSLCVPELFHKMSKSDSNKLSLKINYYQFYSYFSYFSAMCSLR